MLLSDYEYLIRRQIRSLKVSLLRVRLSRFWQNLPWLRLVTIPLIGWLVLTFAASPGVLGNISVPVRVPEAAAARSPMAYGLPEAGRGVTPATGEVQGLSTFKSLSQNPTPQPPARIPDSPDLTPIGAKAAYFIDLASGTVLYEKNSTLTLAPASLTKMMTALVVLDSDQLSAEVTMPESCLALPDSQKMGLVANEKLTVGDLLAGLLIYSASDAACALSSYRVPMSDFVVLMNKKAESLGMRQTKFDNPVGLDELNGGEHYSTAVDLALLARNFLQNEYLRDLVKIPEKTVTSLDGKISHKLVSTDELLNSYPGIQGVKTGYTLRAGGCFVSLVKRGEQEVLGVILGSDDRFGETKSVLDWIYSVYRWM